MVRVRFSSSFKKIFSKIKDRTIRKKILKQVTKIRENPEIGKPMMHDRRGTRELYVKPYRLSYAIQGEIVYVLDVYHKDKQ